MSVWQRFVPLKGMCALLDVVVWWWCQVAKGVGSLQVSGTRPACTFPDMVVGHPCMVKPTHTTCWDEARCCSVWHTLQCLQLVNCYKYWPPRWSEIWFSDCAYGNTSPREGITHTYIPTHAQTASLARTHLIWSVERLHSFDCGGLIWFCSRNWQGPLFFMHLSWSSWVLCGGGKGAGGCGASPWMAVACSDLPWRVPVLSGFWLLFCATFPVVLLAQRDAIVSLETLAGHLSNHISSLLHAEREIRLSAGGKRGWETLKEAFMHVVCSLNFCLQTFLNLSVTEGLLAFHVYGNSASVTLE